MKKTLFCALICALAALATPALARSATPLIDNARVTVHDVMLQPGVQAPAITHAGDYVVLYFQGGRIRAADGKTAMHPSGGAMFGHGGSTGDTALGKPAHEIVVDLKDSPSNTVPNTTGLPPAFPRPGSKLILENDRIRVWNYKWLPGKPTPMHFHNTEVVVAYRGNGDVASTTPDGKTAVNHRNAGDIVFNLANRSHSEELVKGEQSGIMLELK
jgi:predicted metal-dependent enzyme (double-stranded beta helix superfamily)